MADIRVHELAKEFGIESKELLDRLAEMKIPAKNHASTLNAAFVARARKQLGPEMAERAAALESQRVEEEEKKAAEKLKTQQAAEAKRRKAADDERKRRSVERAKRTGPEEPDAMASDGRPDSEVPEPQSPEAEAAARQALKAKSPGRFSGLLSQIEAEQSRLESQRQVKKDAANKAEAEHQAAQAAQASEAAAAAAAAGAFAPDASGRLDTSAGRDAGLGLGEADRAGQEAPGRSAAADLNGLQAAGTQAGTSEGPSPDAQKGSAPTGAASASAASASAGGAAAASAGQPTGHEAAAAAAAATAAAAQPTPETQAAAADKDAKNAKKASSKKAGRPGSDDARPDGHGRHGKGKTPLPASDSQAKAAQQAAQLPLKDKSYADHDGSMSKDEEDRYRKMAAAAEAIQRERVLAEARAAIEAATSEGEGRRKKRKEKREAEAKERIELEAIEKGIDPELLLDSDVIQITTGVTVQALADAFGIPSNDIVKRLFMLGVMMTVTQTMSDDLVELIADDLKRKIRIVSPEEEYAVAIFDSPDELETRPPVVTVMGHVDHGKTSLLDAIRETGVVATEAGGITQHIGASVVHIHERQITFIDTPGHEAFTAMRARGAAVTDIVILVVAADDGVMPQTVEAINHAGAADVPIIVAINKIDKPGANLDRVRSELAEQGIISEEWGGQNMFVEVSAKERIGIDDLLETILLQADVLELKANPTALASGYVIEAKLDKGRGPVATVLVHRGTLRPGDSIVAGMAHGHVRALIDPRGGFVDSATPADPVEVLGLGSVPEAGDEFRVFEDERDARNLAEDRALRKRLAEQQDHGHASLEDLFARIGEGATDLNLVVKADVQGSIEALKDALEKMDQSEVRINVIHSAVGGITETDVTLAAASDAIIIGFGVRPAAKARTAAERERVEIKTYRVIYQAIDDINAARVGLLKP
ncbi:MAG: translation initiation factor IF-2, partial [Coriobacteriia bacterium]|nr:translation initiation factor IF-2 [Coriobacteriia bacterium]